MNNESVISERGQITLPKELRDHFGLKPGMAIEFVPSPKGILLKKSKNGKSPIESVYGILSNGTTTDEYIQKIRGKVE